VDAHVAPARIQTKAEIDKNPGSDQEKVSMVNFMDFYYTGPAYYGQYVENLGSRFFAPKI
jgi:hypothetical protein